jgi:hypothetical protein
MKTHTRHLLTLAILLGFTAQTWAQTSAVPDQISYQGIVTDAGGTPIGNTTPENRTVIFRIWNHPTESLATNLIYSEQQVVTISKGEFSVLVGDGTAVTGNPLGHDPNESTKGKTTVTIPTAFGGSTRFIGVAVYDAGGAVAPEISPRQRVVSSAFAYRAKVAETMNGGTITGAVTATGSTVTGGTFNSGTFTGSVTATGGSFTGTGAGLTSLNASNLSSGTVGDTRLSSNVALLNRATQTFSGSNQFCSGDNAALVIDASPGGNLGFVKKGSTGAVMASSSGQPIVFSQSNRSNLLNNISTSTLTERMRIDSGGNVGIGNAAPNELLTVGGNTGQQGLGLMTATGDPFIRFYDYNSGSPSNKADIYWNRAGNYLGFNSSGINSSFGGNVGIGTTSPTQKLDVAGNAIVGTSDNAALVVDGSGFARLGMVKKSGLNPVIAASSGAAIVFAQSNQTSLFTNIGTSTLTEHMRIDSGGNVGIGTTTPTQGKLTVFGTGGLVSMTMAYFNRSTGTAIVQEGSPNNRTSSIYSQFNVSANEYYAFSDSRIKNLIGQSDGQKDLASLMGIQITDYTFKDTVGRGSEQHKKVIAQQVEKVYPQAVSKSTDVVPDIYQKADLKDGWVELKTDLKKGERVRLISRRGDMSIHEVAEVKKDKFRLLATPEGDEVFVYGREVKDFRAVDYEAISMLNVSATQQIKKEKDAEVKALKDENADLKAKLAAQDTRLATLEAQTQRLAALEAKDKAREAKLAAIEKLLLAADKAAVQPVSLKKSAGGAE